jgi:hypothetical protein
MAILGGFLQSFGNRNDPKSGDTKAKRRRARYRPDGRLMLDFSSMDDWPEKDMVSADEMEEPGQIHFRLDGRRILDFPSMDDWPYQGRNSEDGFPEFLSEEPTPTATERLIGESDNDMSGGELAAGSRRSRAKKEPKSVLLGTDQSEQSLPDVRSMESTLTTDFSQTEEERSTNVEMVTAKKSSDSCAGEKWDSWQANKKVDRINKRIDSIVVEIQILKKDRAEIISNGPDPICIPSRLPRSRKDSQEKMEVRGGISSKRFGRGVRVPPGVGTAVCAGTVAIAQDRYTTALRKIARQIRDEQAQLAAAREALRFTEYAKEDAYRRQTECEARNK